MSCLSEPDLSHLFEPSPGNGTFPHSEPYILKGTEYIVETSPLADRFIWYSIEHDKYGMAMVSVVTLEDVLLNIPLSIQEELIFHLEVFVGGEDLQIQAD
jgi:hypothetical protein